MFAKHQICDNTNILINEITLKQGALFWMIIAIRCIPRIHKILKESEGKTHLFILAKIDFWTAADAIVFCDPRTKLSAWLSEGLPVGKIEISDGFEGKGIICIWPLWIKTWGERFEICKKLDKKFLNWISIQQHISNWQFHWWTSLLKMFS